MPLREALRCAGGIAAALEAAHRKGIIHRDLKPSNIKITAAGAVKVLDFGVAKLVLDNGLEPGTPDLTLTLGGTKEGVLVGTVAYVSPEQAMGDRIDPRSDIWAFGCLLYEMLTAKRAFPGLAVADTLGAVMRGEPDWTALPRDMPHELRTLLRRCLEKDCARRLADIADARLEIDDLLGGGTERARKFAGSPSKTVAAPAPRRGRDRSAGVPRGSSLGKRHRASRIQSAGGTGISRCPDSPTISAHDTQSGGSTWSSAAASREPAASLRFDDRIEDRSRAKGAGPGVRQSPRRRDLGACRGFRSAEHPPRDSPDGRLIVYSARAHGETALWLRSLMFNDAWRLGGTEDGISPFWSPDGASIGFFADRKLSGSI